MDFTKIFLLAGLVSANLCMSAEITGGLSDVDFLIRIKNDIAFSGLGYKFQKDGTFGVTFSDGKLMPSHSIPDKNKIACNLVGKSKDSKPVIYKQTLSFGPTLGAKINSSQEDAARALRYLPPGRVLHAEDTFHVNVDKPRMPIASIRARLKSDLSEETGGLSEIICTRTLEAGKEPLPLTLAEIRQTLGEAFEVIEADAKTKRSDISSDDALPKH